MRKFCLLVLLVLSLLPRASSSAADDPLLKIRPQLDSLIGESKAEKVCVAVYDLESKRTLLINERESLHAASTMKLPVMMEIFRRVKEKKLRLDEPVQIKNQFFSIVDGSEYRLSKADDSDEEVYHRLGQTMTIAELMEHMITWSSNLATNLLIERVSPESIMTLMKSLGASDIQVLRGVEDAKAFQAGKNNTTTAYDLMLLLRAIAEKKFLNDRACEAMINILSAQHFNEGVPAGLPRGTKVAHKTGSITRHNHDAAIVFPPGRKPYVIVVLTRGIAQEKQSSRLIADISRAVWQSLVAGA
jgi:beta-lactamase class A